MCENRGSVHLIHLSDWDKCHCQIPILNELRYKSEYMRNTRLLPTKGFSNNRPSSLLILLSKSLNDGRTLDELLPADKFTRKFLGGWKRARYTPDGFVLAACRRWKTRTKKAKQNTVSSRCPGNKRSLNFSYCWWFKVNVKYNFACQKQILSVWSRFLEYYFESVEEKCLSRSSNPLSTFSYRQYFRFQKVFRSFTISATYTENGGTYHWKKWISE